MNGLIVLPGYVRLGDGGSRHSAKRAAPAGQRQDRPIVRIQYDDIAAARPDPGHGISQRALADLLQGPVRW